MAMIETNYKGIKVFFYHSIAIFFTLLLAGILSEYYAYCLSLGAAIFLLASIAFMASIVFPFYSKSILQILNVLLAVTISLYLFYLDEEKR